MLRKLILILTLAAFCSSCDFIYRLLDKKGAQEKKLIGETLPAKENPTVKEIQILLTIYGYNPGKTDGALGPQTRKAVERFQTDNGLEPTRFVDDPTWEKLSVLPKKQLILNDQLNIKLIQRILKELGYYSGKADGDFGPNTKKAIQTFQKANALKADGLVGYKTLSQLAEHISLQ